jgi:oligopeptide/dipeptide ABC transporter ATP-binding protein
VTAPLLRVEDLQVEIPLAHGTLHAVRGVSLTVENGQAVGLVGESGSGKSLTLRALLGLLPRPARIASGSVFLDGQDLTGMPHKKRQRLLTDTMSMVFQDSLTALNPVMRVGDQIAEAPHRRLGKSARESRAIAIELMSKVGIADADRRYKLYPHELSGGMRQRICIAIALSTQSRLILADEPTTALDVTIQAQVLQVLHHLQQEENVSLLLVSHDLAVVSQTCSQLYVMYAGEVVESGAMGALIRQPQHPYTFSLLRSIPDPAQRVHRLLTIPGQPPDLSEPLRGCPFAPRCPFAVAECAERAPALVTIPSGAGGEKPRSSACLRVHTAPQWQHIVSSEMVVPRP